jgi:hypothetical protein
VRDVLGELTRSLGRLYASEGRPSIPPEQLLSAPLLSTRHANQRPCLDGIVFLSTRPPASMLAFSSANGAFAQQAGGVSP